MTKRPAQVAVFSQSKEADIIQLDERVEKKTRKTEIERLKEELRQKDQEIAYLKDEQGVMSAEAL